MPLDIRTLAVLLVATYVLVAIAMGFLARGNRGERGISHIACGSFIIAIGLAVIALRGAGVAPTLSIILGNGLVCGGMAQMVGGLSRYFGRPLSWTGLSVPVAVQELAIVWFTVVDADISVRTVAFSLTQGWLSALMTLQFLRRPADELWAGPRILVAVTQGWHVLVCLYRAWIAGTTGVPDELLSPHWIHALVFFDGILTFVAFAIGMILVDGQRLQSRLARLAASDPLTGLANRRGFVDQVTAAVTGGPCALLLIDLDHFKAINDHHGHLVGDAVLVAASRRFDQARRPQDSVARLGGEEFAWFMPATTLAEARDRAEALRGDFAARPITIEGHVIDLRLSIGIAACPGDGADWPVLYRTADDRLYRAKDEGRDRVVASTG